jgi:hypothetical protein
MSGQLGYRTARAIAIERDGACIICGTTEALTVHHRLPKRVMRANAPCNLLTLCRDCHDEVERLDQLTSDLAWWQEYFCSAAAIAADMQRGALIVQRAQQLLQQDGGCHGWSHAIELARRELSY